MNNRLGYLFEMNSFNVLWEKTLFYLTQDKYLSAFHYEVWIKELKPVLESDGTYYFEVSTPMHSKLIEEKFGEMIRRKMRMAYKDINGTSDVSINLEFVTPEEIDDLKKTLSQQQEKPQVIEEKSIVTTTLNPNHTFDTFVVGASNEFANAAAKAVSASPGHAYNPLFLYGGVGLGKTHLMHAIGNQILKEHPETKIVYVTSETFTNELINAISRTNNANVDMREQFRNKYRKVDVLMIDDIQFIAGKDKTQDEFFHTFNALHELNKQIVISSDRPPKEMEQLEERMRSRFEWGLIADIEMPDYETRVAILIKKAELMRRNNDLLPINDEVFSFIAKQKDTNIRTLEGALQRVMAYAELHKDELNSFEIDLPFAQKALEDYFSIPIHRTITPKIVIDAVCRYYDISEDDIRGTKKSRDVAFPRQVAMYIMRDITDMSYIKIAEYFGKKDHTTIMYAEDKIKKQIKEDPALKRDIEDIVVKIKE